MTNWRVLGVILVINDERAITSTSTLAPYFDNLPFLLKVQLNLSDAQAGRSRVSSKLGKLEKLAIFFRKLARQAGKQYIFLSQKLEKLEKLRKAEKMISKC